MVIVFFNFDLTLYSREGNIIYKETMTMVFRLVLLTQEFYLMENSYHQELIIMF